MKLRGPWLILTGAALVQALGLAALVGSPLAGVLVALTTAIAGGVLLRGRPCPRQEGRLRYEGTNTDAATNATPPLAAPPPAAAPLPDALTDAALRLRTREALICALARLAESRDDETGRHVDRIVEYVTVLAGHLHQRGRLPRELDLEHLRLAAALHDIGKQAIPDEVLIKPGMLSESQRRVMQRHTVIADQLLEGLDASQDDEQLIRTIRQVVRSHHERWDGGGYPDGLCGEDIPWPARIMAVADVYDALTSRRIYKLPMGHDQACRIITEGSGTWFDPQVVEAFTALAADLAAISQAERTTIERPA